MCIWREVKNGPGMMMAQASSPNTEKWGQESSLSYVGKSFSQKSSQLMEGENAQREKKATQDSFV